LRKDVRTLVLYAKPPEVAALYLQAGERAREVFDEVLLAELISPERRAVLQKAIDAIVATLPPERRP